MKTIFGILLFPLFFSSCMVFSSLKSVTSIDAQDSFILGKNEHGKFKVHLKNISTKPVEVYRAPLGGGKHSGMTVAPNTSVTVKVESNTALVVENASSETVSVQLKVTGDVGLSMNYKK